MKQSGRMSPATTEAAEQGGWSGGAEKACLCVLRDGVVTRDFVNGRGPRVKRVGGMSAKREPGPEHTQPALRRAEAARPNIRKNYLSTTISSITGR